jgi:hypothetical protein
LQYTLSCGIFSTKQQYKEESMPFKRQRPDLIISLEVRETLKKISKSRTEKASRVERAKMILLFTDGSTISAIARQLSTNRPKVERCIDKALHLGAMAALDDLPRSGKPPEITAEAKAWLVNLACKNQRNLAILMNYGPIVFWHVMPAHIVKKPVIHLCRKLIEEQSPKY